MTGDPPGVLPNSSSNIGITQPNFINNNNMQSNPSGNIGVQMPNFVDPAIGTYSPSATLEEDSDDMGQMSLFSLLAGMKGGGNNMTVATGGGGGSGGGGLLGGLSAGQAIAGALNIAPLFCDKRAKKNIEYVSTTKSWVNIYKFEYKDKTHGEGKWVGPMAQEVPYAAIEHNGYLWVDRNKLPNDVPFRQYYGR